MKKSALVLFIFVMITALGACGTQTTRTTASSSEATTSQAVASENTKVDENGWTKVNKVVTVEDIQYTVNAFKNGNGSGVFKPEDGKTYCLIDITVKNNTKEEASLSSILMFDLTDANGNSYDISIGGLASLEEEKLAQLDGSVAASSERRGGLAYEVPENAEGLTLAIKEILGGGDQKVKLN